MGKRAWPLLSAGLDPESFFVWNDAPRFPLFVMGGVAFTAFKYWTDCVNQTPLGQSSVCCWITGKSLSLFNAVQKSDMLVESALTNSCPICMANAPACLVCEFALISWSFFFSKPTGLIALFRVIGENVPVRPQHDAHCHHRDPSGHRPPQLLGRKASQTSGGEERRACVRACYW